jgi:prepilin-type N-terminal cleavage/methylation domain-containing protein
MNKQYQQANLENRKRGFTIIEVVLVLAIAGLIFLMVFIALPTLQRTQRDTQRKDDLSRIQTQISSYSNNNRGKIPTTLNDTFVENYLGGQNDIAGADYVDPNTGTGYKFLDENEVPDAIGEIGYREGGICGADGAFAGGTPRQYALSIMLENQQVPYCVDSR